MIRVLHIVGLMDRGGLETFVMNVLRKIDKNRFSCDILCTSMGEGDYDDEAIALGAHIYHIDSSFYNRAKYIRPLHQFKCYYKWFKSHRYNVIHIHGSHAFDNAIAVRAALRCGCKNVICHSHTNAGIHPILNSLFSVYLRYAPICRIACSEQAGKWLYGEKSQFKVLKNGIDVQSFRFNYNAREKVRNELGLNKNDIVIVHTGRLTAVKNQKYLIDMVQLAHSTGRTNLYLILIGQGLDLDFLLQVISDEKVEKSVILLGLQNDVMPFLSAGDVFVMPSLHEGLPLAAVEAQANGLPVILSDGISPETKLLESTTFLSLSSGVSAWLEATMNAANTKTGINDRIARAEDVKLAGFDVELTVKQLEEIYSQ